MPLLNWGDNTRMPVCSRNIATRQLPWHSRLTNLLLDEQWNELLTVLFQLSTADDSGKRESAFRVFNTTPGIIEKQHEEAVGHAFTKGFKDPEVGVCQIYHDRMSGT